MDNQVKLVSSEGTEFFIDLELAKHSKTIGIFLDENNQFVQSQTMEIKLPIKTKYLKRILEFMKFSSNQINSAEKFEFKILEDETNELLEIASYLRIWKYEKKLQNKVIFDNREFQVKNYYENKDIHLLRLLLKGKMWLKFIFKLSKLLR